MKEKASRLSTEPYKGVRDFYPKEMRRMNYITGIMRSVSERFGYEEYSASVLEPSELYEAKTGEEIVTNETYTFTDRGERPVTLRPEMTPSVARMVAKKRKELVFPLRWYSIPNLFRYERPQRGRLREHWQLNCDLFGVPGEFADAEILTLAHAIMLEFGATEKDFEIRINHRGLLEQLFDEVLHPEEEARYTLSKLLDKKEKISREEFVSELQALIGEKTPAIMTLLEATSLETFLELSPLLKNSAPAQSLTRIVSILSETSITNIRFVPSLMRGFDYYNGMIFEVFDTHPDNRRSLFGGGRYDSLVDIFDVESVPAVGFGMGDVTMADFIETHKLIPELPEQADLFIATISPDDIPHAFHLADTLRTEGLAVVVNITGKKIGDQLSYASKKEIPFVLSVGEREKESKQYPLKNLSSGKETSVSLDDITEIVLGLSD